MYVLLSSVCHGSFVCVLFFFVVVYVSCTNVFACVVHNCLAYQVCLDISIYPVSTQLTNHPDVLFLLLFLLSSQVLKTRWIASKFVINSVVINKQCISQQSGVY